MSEVVPVSIFFFLLCERLCPVVGGACCMWYVDSIRLTGVRVPWKMGSGLKESITMMSRCDAFHSTIVRDNRSTGDRLYWLKNYWAWDKTNQTQWFARTYQLLALRRKSWHLARWDPLLVGLSMVDATNFQAARVKSHICFSYDCIISFFWHFCYSRLLWHLQVCRRWGQKLLSRRG